jgi:hypothetical protein
VKAATGKTATRTAIKSATKTAARTATKAAAPRPKPAPPAKPAASPAPKGVADAAVSAEAQRLAGQIERALAEGDIGVLTPAALHSLMAAACKAYAAQIEAGTPISALGPRTSVTPTEVMITASGLLRAANLAVFELGMWQSWTGR